MPPYRVLSSICQADTAVQSMPGTTTPFTRYPVGKLARLFLNRQDAKCAKVFSGFWFSEF
jgi:hypothetical protein